MTIDVADLLKDGCYRCKRPFTADATVRDDWWPVLDRDKLTYYHIKCLPPNVYHRRFPSGANRGIAAGSRPARQSSANSSLSNEHDTAGG